MSASLWLVPHEGNPFTKSSQELITDTVPSDFPLLPKQHFTPHVTVTSNIDPSKTYEASGTSAQEWLDALDLPEFKKEHDEVVVELDHLEAGDEYYRKLVIEVNTNANLTKLAARCRRDAVLKSAANGEANGVDPSEDAAQKWAENEFKPHMSLMYADTPKAEVKKRLPLVESQVGFEYGSLFACCGGTFCMGGSLVLVPTGKPIEEWKPIAKRATPWVNWRMSRNLA